LVVERLAMGTSLTSVPQTIRPGAVEGIKPPEVAFRLSTNGIRSLNIAGNRESSNPEGPLTHV
jgi:hypothetical protein